MDVKVPRKAIDRRVFNRFGGHASNTVCSFWLAGRCYRNPCRFLHPGAPPQTPANVWRRAVKPSEQSHALPDKESHGSGSQSLQKKSNITPENSPENSSVLSNRSIVMEEEKAPQKTQQAICQCWVLGNCVHGDKCKNLHSWFAGEGFTMLAKLEGHKKAVTGIALPSGSDELYSGSKDGTVRVWDCHTGQCASIIDLGGEIGSLISEGPWLFIGLPNAVKAWNIITNADHSLHASVGQVNAMVVGNEMLLAGAEDGTILAWKSGLEANSFDLAASLKGHSRAVVSLVVGDKRLYSGSIDHTIRVWDLEDLQCIKTLTGHTSVVTSLLCWDHYLLSCSMDQTIKVWVATEGGDLEVTYTHCEEHGVLTLSGMHDADGKPILMSSCDDNSVQLYELPLFAGRGKLFAKQAVRAIGIGSGGLFFTGDGTGQVTVWNWLTKPTSGPQ
ncbi:zinc finger CCCH domain-containing protein 63-like [Malania oleifera]|uniref:zinc finger CCCH domain-containing protein 63-like n=1 Tax=Malania oleifera TaxID=397392 RepID=UPI0025AE38C9|nr:zinc finger CCCH domain-containing protein 63-like [Malania oleifera]